MSSPSNITYTLHETKPLQWKEALIASHVTTVTTSKPWDSSDNDITLNFNRKGGLNKNGPRDSGLNGLKLVKVRKD